MCGIIGLHLRDPELHPMLGALLDDMLCGVSERGPDSVGVAVYGDEHRNPPGRSAVSVLRAPGDLDAAVGDPRAFVGAAEAQVAEIARRVDAIVAERPDAAAYTPAPIL